VTGIRGSTGCRGWRSELAAGGQEQNEGAEEDVGTPDGLLPDRPSQFRAGEPPKPPLGSRGEQDKAAGRRRHVVQVGDDLFNSGNIPVAGIPRLPMLIQSYADFAKADAVLKPYIVKAYLEKGSTLLASYTYPLQFIWGRKKLESLDDIKGLKLRVAQPEQGEFVRSFGGTSITMSAPEVPSALDRGVVDGIFTAGVGAVLWKDLLKYGYVLIINVNNSYFIANTEAYNKLSPDLQGKLRQVAEDTARWDQETMQKEEAESVQVLTAAGYTFTKATPEENERAVKAMTPYWDEWAKSRGPDVIEALAKVRSALGR